MLKWRKRTFFAEVEIDFTKKTNQTFKSVNLQIEYLKCGLIYLSAKSYVLQNVLNWIENSELCVLMKITISYLPEKDSFILYDYFIDIINI